jgi:hypothetical protein
MKMTGADIDWQYAHGVASTELSKAQAEVARLRKGIQDFLDGNYKGSRSYRPGKCPHEVWYFNECEACNDEYFHSLLAAPPK